MGQATMSRKKTEDLSSPTPGPRPTALTIKGSLEWRAWVEAGAEFCRTDVAKLVDAALVEYLKMRGFTVAPPKR